MNVFTIEPGLPFADVLADGLMDRAGHDPIALSGFTVLLPTRRSIRALKDAFLRSLGEAEKDGVLLLPRLLTLGDLDEDELVFEGGLAAGLPPAIDPMRRQLLLARLVMASRANLAWDQAVRLSAELARFLDQMQTQGVALERLKTLVPDDFASHWGEVLKFLNLLADLWPEVLAGENAIDPAERRNRLLMAQAAAWKAQPPRGPIVAAGSTGSIPATATLLKTIAGLPQGAVVLPGLDLYLDDAAWQALDEDHPQFGMKSLLDAMGVERNGVKDWQAARRQTPPARLRLISESFRPAACSDGWRGLAEFPAQAAENLKLLEAPDLRSEALAVALLMREAAEHRPRTAALVTPDRDLARRVASELKRWGIAINDSAGQPLHACEPSVFLNLICQALAEDFAPLPLLALLKHPLAGLGYPPAKLRQLSRELEIKSLRGPRPAPGLGPLIPAHPWLADLEALAGPLQGLMKKTAAGLPDLVTAHIALAEALAATGELTGAERLWAGEAGEAALDFMARLIDASRDTGTMPGAAYPALLEALMESQAVRPSFGLHPRLFIWGPLEARLQQADLLILGGLNEGTWPAEPPADPWLSRPMRRQLGLEAPERRIGLAAHDVAQGLCAPNVVLTRSLKVQGTPTVPSRFVQRLEAVMNATGLLGDAGPEAFRLQTPLDWAEALDHALRGDLPGAPAPCPPLDARPKGLSVTRIETWMRDPYALYAQKILNLKALDPIDADPGAADYGTLIHGVLEAYAKAYPVLPPADIEAELVRMGEEHFAKSLERPGLWAFWWPRFKSVARFVASLEAARRGGIKRRFGECVGRLEVEGFELSAKADRIDWRADGSLSLIDYKTGTLPKWKQVKAGFAPQLPLEAAMLLKKAFLDIPQGKVAELAFWHLSGGRQGGVEQVFKDDIGRLAEEALEGLRGLILAYRNPETRYHACPTPGMEPHWSDYEHLERRAEWQSEEKGA